MAQSAIPTLGLIGLCLCMGCGQDPPTQRVPVPSDNKVDKSNLEKLDRGSEKMHPLPGASDSGKDTSSATVFWGWFQAHEAELFDFERDQEAVFDRLTKAMGAVHKDLTFEFGPKENGCREFVISAGGLREAFPAVQSLYQARPKLQLFRVTAFRPRRDVINVVEFGGLRIDPSDVYYKFGKDSDPQKVGILLFLARLFLAGFTIRPDCLFVPR